MISILTEKERMRRALGRQPGERLPTRTNYAGAKGAKRAVHFQCSTKDLAARFNNHLLRQDSR